MSIYEKVDSHPIFSQIDAYLSADSRFIYKGRNVVGGKFYEMTAPEDLIGPCSGTNLDRAQFNIKLLEINSIGVEVHIEMCAIGINEWETVFWGTCHSFQFFIELLHYALGLPKQKTI